MMALETLSARDLVQELLARRDMAESSWLDFCEAAWHVIRTEAWVTAGYPDPVRFFEDRVKVSYRGLRRSLTIFEAVMALPPAEQEDAKTALVRIGKHKAAALAPLFLNGIPDDDGTPAAAPDWRAWTARAERLTEKALQAEVTEHLGHGRTPAAEETPGERFYAALRVYIPEDARAEVDEVFACGRRIAGTDNNVAVFLNLVREVHVEWEHRAAEKYR